MRTLVAFLAAAVIGKAALHAAEPSAWSRFRGPDGSGVADGQKPPIEVGPERNVRWKVPVPSGLSSPIVAGGNLVLTAFDDGRLFTIAYDRATGREAWRAEAPAKELEAFHKTEGSPAASTPATDGTRIVSYFGSCGIFCYDLAGRELWRFEQPPVKLPGEFGSGVSPILADGLVVLVRDQTKDSKILAVDAETGKLRWEQSRRSPTSYSTPIVWETPAGRQVAVAGHAQMIGYDLRTGAEKWSVLGTPSGCCSSPVVADGLLLFAGGSPGGEDAETTVPTFDSLLKDLDADKDGALSRAEAEKAFQGFFDNQDTNKDGKLSRDEWDAIQRFMAEGKNAAFALKAGGAGDVSGSHVVWQKSKGLPYVPSAIAYRGQYVMVKDDGIVTAYDVKTGAMRYQSRSAAAGRYYASPVAADGRIYCTSLDGAITVLKAGGDKAAVLAENPKLDERTSATPAIAGDTLYVRTDKHLWAFAGSK